MITFTHKYFLVVGLDLTIQYSLAQDDSAVNDATQSLIRQCISYARSRGLDDPYLYLNYALKEQDPYAGYGNSLHQSMRAVASKYDPGQAFQKLVPGGFKLWRDLSGVNRPETCCE